MNAVRKIDKLYPQVTETTKRQRSKRTYFTAAEETGTENTEEEKS